MSTAGGPVPHNVEISPARTGFFQLIISPPFFQEGAGPPHPAVSPARRSRLLPILRRCIFSLPDPRRIGLGESGGTTPRCDWRPCAPAELSPSAARRQADLLALVWANRPRLPKEAHSMRHVTIDKQWHLLSSGVVRESSDGSQRLRTSVASQLSTAHFVWKSVTAEALDPES